MKRIKTIVVLGQNALKYALQFGLLEDHNYHVVGFIHDSTYEKFLPLSSCGDEDKAMELIVELTNTDGFHPENSGTTQLEALQTGSFFFRKPDEDPTPTDFQEWLDECKLGITYKELDVHSLDFDPRALANAMREEERDSGPFQRVVF